jgi:hypothetical protein
MKKQISGAYGIDSRLWWIFFTGAAAALIAGLALLIGLILMIVTLTQPNLAFGWLAALQNNWLVKIFNNHAQIAGAVTELQGINLLDVAILLLTGLIAIGFIPVVKKARQMWVIAASVLTIVGVILYLVTQLNGRSTVMLVVMIVSVVMVKQIPFGKFIPYAGIVAGACLFLGDLTVGFQSLGITILFGIGYILLIFWFFLVAYRFYRLWSENRIPLHSGG